MLNLNYSVTNPVWSKDDGTVVVPLAHSWSGNNSNPEVNKTKIQGKNNAGTVRLASGLVVPAQSIKCIGAIPCGVWHFGEWGDWETIQTYPKHLGRLICHLTQVSGETYHRDGIYVHGPASGPLYGEESEGCIVVLHDERAKIALLMPTTLTVVP